VIDDNWMAQMNGIWLQILNREDGFDGVPSLLIDMLTERMLDLFQLGVWPDLLQKFCKMEAV
jgi:hypothetical protein